MKTCNKENILSWKNEGTKLGLIDIREFYETPEIDDEEVQHVPMGDILSFNFEEDTTYVLICGSGRRATAVSMEINKISPEVKVYALDGGAEAYLT